MINTMVNNLMIKYELYTYPYNLLERCKWNVFFPLIAKAPFGHDNEGKTQCPDLFRTNNSVQCFT